MSSFAAVHEQVRDAILECHVQKGTGNVNEHSCGIVEERDDERDQHRWAKQACGMDGPLRARCVGMKEITSTNLSARSDPGHTGPTPIAPCQSMRTIRTRGNLEHCGQHGGGPNGGVAQRFLPSRNPVFR